MARTAATSSDGTLAHAASAVRVAHVHSSSRLKYVPGFLYILVLYVVGKFIFSDPRAILVEWGQYQLTWVEVLMVGAAMMAMAEQLRVSHPGIDNTVEANLAAATVAPAGVAGQLFNVACGAATSLNDVVRLVAEIVGHPVPVSYVPGRVGDVKHSLADVTAARTRLGYQGAISFAEGLRRTVAWYAARR